jgi:NTP pyrophosphatase (non-canonical NTP hydrolase)
MPNLEKMFSLYYEKSLFVKALGVSKEEANKLFIDILTEFVRKTGEDMTEYSNATNSDEAVPSLLKCEDAASLLVRGCHGRAYAAGWWHDPKTGESKARPVPELLCLIHSEISEALEGFRKNLMDDHLPHRKMLEVELADAVIRIFDMCGGYGLDIGGALAEKLEYNSRRADHKPENRAKDGGKSI